ncbi:MAG TPA: flagellar motor protein MotB [Bryobacteraceae bacterium]
MKRHKAAQHENHERWLVSYADFITLLFAFFVVMFATAQKDKTKQRMVAEAVREALEHGQLTAAITGILNHTRVPPAGKGDSRVHAPLPENPGAPGPAAPKLNLPDPGKPAPATKEDLLKSLDALQRGLEEELKSGKLTVTVDKRGLVISLREAAFFASGDDAINTSGYSIIEKIAQEVAKLQNPLRLEGHTDSVPIHNARFASNWELSVARSIAMLELLRQRYQFPSERMSVAGFAENAPADTNETEQGRAHNRRVDVVVLSAEAMTGEPPTLKP